jgi:hypothetical protein
VQDADRATYLRQRKRKERAGASDRIFHRHLKEHADRHIDEVAFAESLWTWRIYLPPGNRSLHVGSSLIADTGTKVGSGAGASMPPGKAQSGTSPRDPLQCEYTLTARIERDQLGNLQLVVTTPRQRLALTLMPRDSAWISDQNRLGLGTTRKIQAVAAGSHGKTESFAADDAVVLLRLRAPDSKQAASGEPCDGVMIWFAPEKHGKR